ncbi:MAG: putative manganese transporter [Patescibacteria group bacterium]
MYPAFLTETILSTFRIAIIIIPLLFFFEWLNHRYGEKIEAIIKRSKYFMPLVGATFGLLPGCNVAVITAIFYTQGVASLGTLIAALIATSDEAIFVFIPLGFNFIPLLIAKFILALIAGYSIDFFFHPKFFKNSLEKTTEIDFCCAEHPHNKEIAQMFKHTLKHGARIVLIVFLVLLSLNYIQDRVSVASYAHLFTNYGYFQPSIIGLIGLIPGCGTSVGIATLYTKEVITFGAAVAGLSTASGEALIVLYGQGLTKKRVIKIAAILFTFSVIWGTLIQITHITF